MLDAGNDADLHYAALDLRLCIEAITYGKLQSFTEHLPPSMLQRTWQPPQLLKAMMQVDPHADKSFTMSIGLETSAGAPPDPAQMTFIGQHHAFGYAWLRKQYNKLGSMLHMQNPANQPAQQIERADTSLPFL